jgi:hypothetical protein
MPTTLRKDLIFDEKARHTGIFELPDGSLHIGYIAVSRVAVDKER